MIGALAVRTGISPLELLKTPPRILAVMVEQVWPRADIKTGADAWQGLASTDFG